MSGPGERHPEMSVRVDGTGVVRLTWRDGLQITEELARRAMDLVDEVNGDRQRPLLVDMSGTAVLTREARIVFTRRCSASTIALLGRSAVDRVLANFGLRVNSAPVPTRFFTSEAEALEWLSFVHVET